MKYFTFQVHESPRLRVLSGWLFAVVLLSTMTAVLVLNQSEGKTLELVQVLFRHGERTPAKHEHAMMPYVPASVYDPYGFGQLTNTGRLQAYELGLLLRKRYQNYLNDAYHAEDLYAYSSDSERTATTIQLVLAGLYPPTKSCMWNPALNWQPIPYYYTPSQFDVLLKSSMNRPFEELYIRDTDHLIRAKNVEYSDILKILGDKYGLHLPKRGRQDGMGHVYNMLHSHENMGIPLPDWCTPDVLERLKSYIVFGLDCHSYTRQLRRIHGGPLLEKFVENMNIDETMNNPRKMYFYSGHDQNIGAVIRILGVKDFEYPDFMSVIILEKLRDADGRLYVRLIGRRTAGEELETLKIGDCDEICPIDEFLGIVDDAIPSHEEMHHLETAFKKLNQSITDDVFLRDPYVKER